MHRRRERAQRDRRNVREDEARGGVLDAPQAVWRARIRAYWWVTRFSNYEERVADGIVGLMVMPRTPIKNVDQTDVAGEGGVVDASLLPPG